MGRKGLLKSNNVVSWLDRSHTRSNRLNNTGSLVTENDWKGALWVLAGKSVCVWVELVADSHDLSLASVLFFSNA